jgi:hypothetical protein
MRRLALRSLLILTLLLTSVLLTPLRAGADPGVTITVGPQATLLDPTLVRVPVQITCDAMEVATNQGSAELRQAVSKQLIAHGTGWEESQILCDGQPHPNSYLIWADPSGPPFTKGTATVSISAFLCDATFACQSGSSGIQSTRLSRG